MSARACATCFKPECASLASYTNEPGHCYVTELGPGGLEAFKRNWTEAQRERDAEMAAGLRARSNR